MTAERRRASTGDAAAGSASRRPVPPRGARPARRHDARLVHAPGRPRAARVPRDPRARDAARDHPRRRAVRRGHAPARAPPRRRRRDPVRRHHDAAGRARDRVRHRRGRRPGHRASRSARPPTSPRSARSSRRPRSRRCSRRSGSSARASPVPLIGFAGAPFTLACYLVEGGPSRDFLRTKRLMHDSPRRGPRSWTVLVEATSATSARRSRPAPRRSRCSTRGSAGSQPLDYELRVPPWMRRLFDGLADLGVPTTHFGTGTAGLLALQASAGGDVIGLDWRIALADGRRLVGDRAVQGNLDPALLLGPWDAVEEAARWVLDQNGGRPGHVFNLGHGVLPGTDPDALAPPGRPRARGRRRGMSRDAVLVVGGGITGLAAARRAGAATASPVTLVGGRAAARGQGLDRARRRLRDRGRAGLDPRDTPGRDRAGPRPGPRRPADRGARHRDGCTSATGASSCRSRRAWGSCCRRSALPFVRTRLFSVAEKLRMARDVVWPRILRAGGRRRRGRSSAARLGSPLVDRLAGPLVGGVYGTPIDELSPGRGRAPAARRGARPPEPAARRAGGRARDARRRGRPTDRGAGLRDVRLAARRDGRARDGAGSIARGGRGRRSRPGARSGRSSGPAPASRRGSPTGRGPVRRRRSSPRRRRSPPRLLADEVPGAAAALATIPHGSSIVVALGYPRDRVGRDARRPRASRPGRGGRARSPPRPGRPRSGPAAPPTTWCSCACPSATSRRGRRATTRRSSRPRATTSSGRCASPAEPVLTRLMRWTGSMPRYTVGHLGRVATIEAAMTAWPAVTLAGASYRGVGLPDCIAQGQAAAARVAAWLASNPGRRTPRRSRSPADRPLDQSPSAARSSGSRSIVSRSNGLRKISTAWSNPAAR